MWNQEIVFFWRMRVPQDMTADLSNAEQDNDTSPCHPNLETSEAYREQC